jgi:hypothetical protein
VRAHPLRDPTPSSKKDRTRILTLGWHSTKLLIEPAGSRMTSIATIMTLTSFAMPAVVIIESRENTMSRSRIRTSTRKNAPEPAGRGSLAMLGLERS